MKRSNFLNGKIKAEFGNLDQIKMIKEIEESDNAFKDGFIPEIESRFTVKERCHCGDYDLEFDATGKDVFDALDGEKAECRKCGRKYKLVNVKQPHWLFQDDLVDTILIKYQ